VLHDFLRLFQVGTQDLGVRTVLGVVDENVVVVELLGEASLVPKGPGGLEAYVETTGIFLGSN
jgi:hypothetical protein